MIRTNKKRIQKLKDYELILTSLRYAHAKNQKDAIENVKRYPDYIDFASIYNETENQFYRLIRKYQTKADKLRKKIRRKVK